MPLLHVPYRLRGAGQGEGPADHGRELPGVDERGDGEPANLDRPVVTYADDWEIYSQVRGVTFDLLSGRPGDTPGAVATTEHELVDTLRSGRWRGTEAATLRAAFRERFCRYDDGHAAERVVRHFFLGQEAGPATVPLAQRTPAPSPALG